MRTKTLLIAAAALAATVISSEAQVYSANVVGYVNVTIQPNQYVFGANQLLGANNNNQITNVLVNGNYQSDANGVTNTTLFWWNGNGYTVYQYYSAADGGTPAPTWQDALGNITTNSVNQSSAFFFFNPSGVPVTATLVGTVVSGTNSVPIAQGFNAFSVIAPLGGSVTNELDSFPGGSPGDGNGNTYDTYYQYFNGAFRTLTYEQGADANPGQNGWYDALGNYQNTNSTWWPQVGQGFFILHMNPAVTNWVQTFNIQ